MAKKRRIWFLSAFTNLLFGQRPLWFRITSFLLFLAVMYATYQYYFVPTNKNVADLNSKLTQCIDNRRKDANYISALRNTIEANRANAERVHVIEPPDLPEPAPPPPPPPPTIVERVINLTENTKQAVAETTENITSKVFTPRKFGVGYIGVLDMNGIGHGAYLRYDIISVWNKSINLGFGGLYKRYNTFTMEGPVRRTEFLFVFMGGIEF